MTPRASADSGVAASAPKPRALRTALLRWYDRNRRDLPWRRTRDPYAIWISESMLQQTRVETVIPYYERFLTRFPTVHALADAPEDDVTAAWAGLGYYSRARNLQKAARTVVEEWDGALPDDAAGLRSLPGIGRYTAGAVASIAFDRPEPVLDGNVMRVLSRLHRIEDDIRRKPVQDEMWEHAGALARGARPGDLNQALMELGATVCTPRAPRCLACPAARWCRAHAEGCAEALPVKSAARPPKTVTATSAWLARRGRLLVVRRPRNGLLAGMWQPPGDDLATREKPATGVVRAVRERTGLEIEGLSSLGVVEHGFTHRALSLHVFRAAQVRGRVRLDGFEEHRWVAPAALPDLFHNEVSRKTLTLARDAGLLG